MSETSASAFYTVETHLPCPFAHKSPDVQVLVWRKEFLLLLTFVLLSRLRPPNMEPRAGNMANRQETTADRQQTTDMYDEIQIKFAWHRHMHEKIRYEM